MVDRASFWVHTNQIKNTYQLLRYPAVVLGATHVVLKLLGRKGRYLVPDIFPAFHNNDPFIQSVFPFLSSRQNMSHYRKFVQ